MGTLVNKKVASILLIAGVISLVMGGIFLYQGFAKHNLIMEVMALEKIEYGGADGLIVGIIDTPEEAQAMAEILKEHRQERGVYTDLARDDPNRATILNALTMENSLNLAQLGHGLTEVVQVNGIFMMVIGLTLVSTGAYVIRAR